MHDITGHRSGVHSMVCSHERKKVIRVNTTHHQMCLPGKGSYIVGWVPNRKSMYYIGHDDERVNYPGPEVEAIIFPKAMAFAVQYHPEMMSPGSDGWKYYHDAVQDLLELTVEEFVEKYRGIEHVSTESEQVNLGSKT